jgi:TP901-1 family phage major tail protein
MDSMAIQRGKDVLLKIDVSGEGQFETVAGLRATRISFNAETVEVTSLESPGGWISGSGVFRDASSDERARQIFFDGEVARFQVVIPAFGIVEGPFQITALEYGGRHDGEATYEVGLASAGALGFTAL